MTEPKFTPGPWMTDEKDHDTPYQNIKIKSGHRLICTVWIDDAPVHDFNCEQSANTHLIVAAPELYEALVLARDVIEINHKMKNKDWDGSAEPFSAIGVVRAALAKARGEQ